jgi:mono/diheme cytochrome c family protein
MKRTVVLLAAAGVALLAVALPAAAQDKAKAEQGAALFTSQKCAMCHSIAGKGNAKGPLDNVNAKNKTDDIRKWILDPEGMRTKTNATRAPAMKAMKLSPDQVDALVAYLASLKPVKSADDAGK